MEIKCNNLFTLTFYVKARQKGKKHTLTQNNQHNYFLQFKSFHETLYEYEMNNIYSLFFLRHEQPYPFKYWISLSTMTCNNLQRTNCNKWNEFTPHIFQFMFYFLSHVKWEIESFYGFKYFDLCSIIGNIEFRFNLIIKRSKINLRYWNE